MDKIAIDNANIDHRIPEPCRAWIHAKAFIIPTG